MKLEEKMKELAMKAAIEAGKTIRATYEQFVSAELPNPFEPESWANAVTVIEEGAEESIIGMIEQNFPDHNILAEESSKHRIKNDKEGIIDRSSDYTWLIDPLDGSNNFKDSLSRNLPMEELSSGMVNPYGVSIAVRKKDEVIVGVIYIPNTKNLLTAVKGQGAYIDAERMRVSKQTELSDAVVSYICEEHYERTNNMRLLEKLKEKTNAVAIKSTSVELAYVALGKFDGLAKARGSPWGYSAACLMIEEAGGIVTDFEGKRWNTESKTNLGANPVLHKKLYELVRKYKS